MSYANPRSALQQYTKSAVQSEVMYATPYRLVQMLMEGALDKIAAAKGQIEHQDLSGKNRNITWAVSIINGLRAALDMKAGGVIADNLNNLYDYMARRLMQANLENDARMLDEVARLLGQIKSGWDAIPEGVRNLRPATGA